MSKIQGFIRAIVPSPDSPNQLLSRVNRLAFDNMENMSFVTLVMAELHTTKKTITVVRAGHTPILHYQHTDKQFRRWEPPGIALALDRDTVFSDTLKEETVNVNEGDVFLFYSDGLIEAEDTDGEEYGLERLEKTFSQCVHLRAEAIGNKILADIDGFSGEEQQKDDMTLVVIKIQE
jgi:serine phosphatase RsbU (regulator of sigma subunit)